MNEIFLLILAILWVIYFVIAVKVSEKFESIAEMKGHNGYFWWCFWLGPVGWAMVIALPDRKIEFPDYSKLIVSMMKQPPTQFVQNVSVPAHDDSLPEL